MFGTFPVYLEGQRGPIHEEFRGRWLSGGGGSAWEVSVEILYVYAILGGPDIGHRHTYQQLHGRVHVGCPASRVGLSSTFKK